MLQDITTDIQNLPTFEVIAPAPAPSFIKKYKTPILIVAALLLILASYNNKKHAVH